MYDKNKINCNKPKDFLKISSYPEKVYHFVVGGDMLSFIPTSPIWRGIFPANFKFFGNEAEQDSIS